MENSELVPAPGVLLIAPPMLNDANFRRSVVLLCEHGPEGSFGLILNRPLTLKLSEVVEDFERSEQVLSLGGPVQPNTLHFLHRCGDRVPEAISIIDGVFWGGDFDALPPLLEAEEKDQADFRFFLGYAGWSPEQLDAEIEAGGWILTQAGAAEVFQPDPDRLWRGVLRRMGGEYAILANYPDDPRMN
jgi:putative transcriptional regulator